MQTLGLALKARDSIGEPIPDVYPGLAAVKAHIRRGQLSMIVGPPGGGKTALMTDWVLNADATGDGDRPAVLYFSADSDKSTVANRVAASVTTFLLSECEEYLLSGRYGILQKVIDATRHIWWCFDTSLTMDSILAEIQAYAYVNGAWPDWIIVDNLVNVRGDESGTAEHTVYAAVMDFLHELAGSTMAAVTVLHHATGGYADASSPLPLSGVLGQVNRPQRLILTINRPRPDRMGISVVKNSNGPADPKGYGVQVELPVELSRMWFGKS